MCRMILTVFTTLGGLAAVSAQSPPPSTPLPPPASSVKPASPSSPPAMMSATPTVTPQMVADSCAAHDDCGSLSCCGIRSRLASLWSGRRCHETITCPSCFPGYAPDGWRPEYHRNVLPSCVQCGGPRFGTGRFAAQDCCETECDPWRPLRNHLHFCFLHREHCGRATRCDNCVPERERRELLIERARCREGRCCRVPTPFITPARLYFYNTCDIQWPTCCNQNCSGQSPASTCGLGIGSGVVNRDAARRAERQVDCGDAGNCGRGHLFKHKWERHDWANGCCVLGQPFPPCLRFARDEPMAVPAITVSDPDSGYGLNYHYYFTKKDAATHPATAPVAVPNAQQANPVMQAGYKAR